MLRIAILDDHPAVLAGLRRLLDAEPDLTVVAAGPSPAALARELGVVRPDVLVVDYDLGGGDGLSHCRRVKARARPPAVIVYSAYASPALTLAARVAQADAVVDKGAPVPALLSTLRRVGRAERLFSDPPRDAYDGAVAKLDDEDLPVFAMLLDGEPPEAIAGALRIDPGEVAWRQQRIVGRLRPRVRPPVDDPMALLGRR